MVARLGRSRRWFVIWELLALVWLVVAWNRTYVLGTFVTPELASSPMAWKQLLDTMLAGAFAALCAFIGLLPAAWASLGPARSRDEASANALTVP